MCVASGRRSLSFTLTSYLQHICEPHWQDLECLSSIALILKHFANCMVAKPTGFAVLIWLLVNTVYGITLENDNIVFGDNNSVEFGILLNFNPFVDTMAKEKGKVPAWDGNPALLEQFVVECGWYKNGLKPEDRKLAASRVWRELTGPAKRVVRRLKPEDFGGDDGLDKLLAWLKKSPLGRLPLPDAFQKIDHYQRLKKQPNETFSEFIVREEEIYGDLQAAMEKLAEATASKAEKANESDEEEWDEGAEEEYGGWVKTKKVGPAKPTLYEDMMRGYKLLRASGLSRQERNSILSVTGNRTDYDLVASTMRAQFDPEDGNQQNRTGRVWTHDTYFDDYDEGWNEAYYEDSTWADDGWTYYDDEIYYEAEEWDDGWQETAEDPELAEACLLYTSPSPRDS